MSEQVPHPAPDPIPSIELLESGHTFPGRFTIKAIGSTADDFVERVLAQVLAVLPAEGAVVHSLRPTPAGRHVSVSLDLGVDSAEQVRAVYTRLHKVEGLVMLL